MKTNAEKSSSSFFFYSPFPGLAGTAALKIRNGQCRNVRGGILAYLVDRSWRLQASLGVARCGTLSALALQRALQPWALGGTRCGTLSADPGQAAHSCKALAATVCVGDGCNEQISD